MDFQMYNDAEKQHIQRIIEQKQMRDFLKFYTSLVERCFDDCVNDFTSKALTSKEEACINRCADKFLKHNERVGQRFGELNQQLMQQQQQAQQPQLPQQSSSKWF
ncbi:3626_t:CDS:2 [Racocetra fulgida]|uniref:Mitochondrial import inner membrane translocase subunit n=1 Tax=Racocetra fulgida TaxID=60492 RepID=A0A9N9I3U2_9GLOM|nr:3626_t:CDS:2 [Racocetra fulgida]